VRINPERIFIIDPRGNVKISIGRYISTYVKLNEIVDQLFPPITLVRGVSSQFSSFNYWRDEPPKLSANDLSMLSAAK
jgi:phosphatidate phosphatase PAH1